MGWERISSRRVSAREKVGVDVMAWVRGVGGAGDADDADECPAAGDAMDSVGMAASM